MIAFPAIEMERPGAMLRALELSKRPRFDSAEAHLVARAEAMRIDAIAPFERALDRVGGVRRVEL